MFLSSIVNAPAQLIDGYPHHLQKRFKGTKATDFKWHFVDHHIAHAASAFYPSPFNKAAVLTLDGRAVGALKVAFRHKLKESLTKEAVVSFLCSPVTYPIAWKRKIERRVIVMRKWNRRTITKSA